jgi:hypothetical protein
MRSEGNNQHVAKNRRQNASPLQNSFSFLCRSCESQLVVLLC